MHGPPARNGGPGRQLEQRFLRNALNVPEEPERHRFLRGATGNAVEAHPRNSRLGRTGSSPIPAIVSVGISAISFPAEDNFFRSLQLSKRFLVATTRPSTYAATILARNRSSSGALSSTILGQVQSQGASQHSLHAPFSVFGSTRDLAPPSRNLGNNDVCAQNQQNDLNHDLSRPIVEFDPTLYSCQNELIQLMRITGQTWLTKHHSSLSSTKASADQRANSDDTVGCYQ